MLYFEQLAVAKCDLSTILQAARQDPVFMKLAKMNFKKPTWGLLTSELDTLKLTKAFPDKTTESYYRKLTKNPEMLSKKETLLLFEEEKKFFKPNLQSTDKTTFNKVFPTYAEGAEFILKEPEKIAQELELLNSEIGTGLKTIHPNPTAEEVKQFF